MPNPSANLEPPGSATPQVDHSGIVAGRDVSLQGHNVAGRDLYITQIVQHMQSPAPTMFQLPPDISTFVGRDGHIAALLETLRPGSDPIGAAVAVCAVAGKAGVGKTALALHVAHRLGADFPDGQLYVDLRGHAKADALDPSEVLAGFLREFGVTETTMPSALEERSRLFRSYIARKRVLVVLDNAADEAQVRPLLPGNSSCAVLLTSRPRLTMLEVHRMVVLEVLTTEHAVELFHKIVGAPEDAKQRAAAEEIVRLCGALPLAIRIAAGRLVGRPRFQVVDFAVRLRDERRRLDELRAGDREVRSSFDLSYRGLDKAERRAFRLVALPAVPDFAAPTAAAVLDRDEATTAELIERLVDVQLLEVGGRDDFGQPRYKFHDLLRVFARERLVEEDTATSRSAALERVLIAHSARARVADAVLQSGRIMENSPVSPEATYEERLEQDPLSWFSGEQAGLVALVGQGYKANFFEAVRQIALALAYFFDVRGYVTQWQYTQEIALEAARQTGDRPGEADTLRSIGIVRWELGHWNAALTSFEESLHIALELSDLRRQASAQNDLGIVHRYAGRDDEALHLFEQSIATFRALDDRLWEAYVRRDLGGLYMDQGRWSDAIATFESCLVVFREFGERRAEARTLNRLGDIHRQRGRHNTALDYYTRCRRVFREFGDRRWEAYTAFSLAELYRDQGDLERATVQFIWCLEVFQELGDRLREGRTLLALGQIAFDAGDAGLARARSSNALELFELMQAPDAASARATIAAIDQGEVAS